MNDSFQPLEPPVIPDHQLIRRIGRGNYGEIWLAKTVMGIFRAVKIVYRERFDDDRPYEREFEGIQQFEPLSRNHPGFVDILQVGRNERGGYFYYIMELADDEAAGRPFHPDTYAAKTLSKVLASEGRLAMADVLDIGRDLAAALEHLHRHGLVHRDVKPANIIFVNGEPKLADIGLVAPQSASSTYVGTPDYMPREGPGAPQADIFALGKVLYEISTGQSARSFPDLPENVNDFPDAEAVLELNEVVTKACQHEAGERHESAEGLRGELELLRGGHSIRWLRVVEERLRRTKNLTRIVGAVAAITLIFGLAASYLRFRERRMLAAAHVTTGTRFFEDGNYHAALPSLAEALRLQLHNDEAEETHRVRIGTLLQQSPRLLQFLDGTNSLSDVRFSADGVRLLLAGGRRAWIVNAATGELLRDFPVGPNVETAVFSPDETYIAVAHGRFVSIIEVATGTKLSYPHGKNFLSAEFSPDGAEIVAACEDSSAHIINARDATLRDQLIGHEDHVLYAAFSPDGSTIVTASRDGTARLWDAKTTDRRLTLEHGGWIYGAAFSPDGRSVVTAGANRTLRLWSTNGSPTPARMEHHSLIRRVSFSPDGRFIVSAGLDQTAKLWDADDGRPVGTAFNLHSAVMQAVFDADARRLAVIGIAGEIKIWHVHPDAPRNLGPLALVSGDGSRYLTVASNDVQFWNAHDDSHAGPAQRVEGKITTSFIGENGQRVVLQVEGRHPEEKRAQVFDFNGVSTNAFLVPGSGSRWWLDGGGNRLLTGAGMNLWLWNLDDGRMIFGPIPMSNSINSAAFSPDGRAIAVASDMSTKVFLLDARTGNEWAPPLSFAKTLRSVAFSPDSRRLAAAMGTGGFTPCSAEIWELETRRCIGAPIWHADGVKEARFSHNGRWLTTSGEDNRAGVWDAASGAAQFNPILHFAAVRAVQFSPDDRWLITVTRGAAQIRDARTGHAVTPAFTDPALLERAGFFAGKNRLWARSERGVLVWNLPRAEGSPDELTALAHQLGVAVGPTLRWQPDARSQAKWRARAAAEDARTRAQLDVWHLEQASLSEARRDWFAAQFHLEKFLRTSPNDAASRARLENARRNLNEAIR